jgi:hypothetical protein
MTNLGHVPVPSESASLVSARALQVSEHSDPVIERGDHASVDSRPTNRALLDVEPECACECQYFNVETESGGGCHAEEKLGHLCGRL